MVILENTVKIKYFIQLSVHIINESHSFGLIWAIIRIDCFPLPTVGEIQLMGLQQSAGRGYVLSIE